MVHHEYAERYAQRLSLISIFALQLSAETEFLSDVLRDSSYTRQDKGQIKVSQGMRNTRGEPKRLSNFFLRLAFYAGKLCPSLVKTLHVGICEYPSGNYGVLRRKETNLDRRFLERIHSSLSSLMRAAKLSRNPSSSNGNCGIAALCHMCDGQK